MQFRISVLLPIFKLVLVNPPEMGYILYYFVILYWNKKKVLIFPSSTRKNNQLHDNVWDGHRSRYTQGSVSIDLYILQY